MERFTKRLKLQTDCIGLIQKECMVDASAYENAIGPMILEKIADQYPDALTVSIQIDIQAVTVHGGSIVEMSQNPVRQPIDQEKDTKCAQ